MTIPIARIPFPILLATLLAGCATQRGVENKSMTLKHAFKHDFSIGVAINQRQFTGQDTNGVAIITSQFNSIAPENALKWDSVHPRPGPDGYDFAAADAYVAFGEKHHMLVVGHTLVWHGQTPAWVFRDDSGRPLRGTNAADRALLLQRLHDHIQTVVGRYRGKIKVWDVVNEALNDAETGSDTNMLQRRSPWTRILGPEFIVKAFEWAHETDPKAILRYNDYSIENPAKRQRLIDLITMLKALHAPVMAIGLQTHANLTWPSPASGQHIRTGDVSANAGAGGGDESLDAAAQEAQSNQYVNLFTAFCKHRDAVKLVTFWNVTDGDSWLRGQKPLLFDMQGKPKPAFDAVINVAKNARH